MLLRIYVRKKHERVNIRDNSCNTGYFTCAYARNNYVREVLKLADLSFARKYRPSTIKGYVGNDKVKKTAFAALNKAVRPQVIMLEGASGCGKTTFARLLAKEYLCENRDPVKGACGCCPNCQAVDDYIQTGSTDMLECVKEIDIADQSGKRDIDTVLDDMMIPAFEGEWKIYIFDECHMATPQAQNRMLKVAEEPPENVLIVFCTTNPEEMLETLLNRCQLQLHVKKPTVAELGGLLKQVCSFEGADCDTKGVNFIANRADLTIRKALSYLERVLTEKGSAKYVDAVDVFEEISDTQIVSFYKKLIGTPQYENDGSVKRNANGTAVYKRDVLGYVTLLHDIKTKMELKMFVRSLIDFTIRGIYVVNQIDLDGVAEGELKMYRDLFGMFTVEQMACLINKLTDLSRGDVETKLLLLGYTGIMDDSSKSDSTDSGLAFNPEELALEAKREVKSRDEKRQVAQQENVDKIEQMAAQIDFDELQKMFGGATIT